MMRHTVVIGLGVELLLFGLVGCRPQAAATPPATRVPATEAVAATEEPSPPTPTATSRPEPTAVPTSTPEPPPATAEPAPAGLTISSEAFEPGGAIPEEYSCFGDNMSPPLNWSGVSGGSESLALIVRDPDSSPPGFVHWVVYNVPVGTGGLPKEVPPEPTLLDGTLQGENDFAQFGSGVFPGGSPIHQVGYDGPCPPGGEHRYVFTLYALDIVLDLPPEATVSDVTSAMEGHILARAEVTGVYIGP